MNPALLEAHDLHKTYQKGAERIDVIAGVSFRVSSGETVSIVGASGAGKSTLLHLLGTLDRPDAGEIIYDGTSVNTLSSHALADLRNTKLGFVFQFHHLLPEFSALENVAMPALIRRIERQKAEELARQALEDVGLGHRLSHKPGELSGGEQQRVALARALVLQPPLLLADEVTGNLDDKTGEEIHELLFSLNRTKKITIIVVTHNRSLAHRMQRHFELAQGHLREYV